MFDITPEIVCRYHLQRLDYYLGWVAQYTAWNAPYNQERCREYSRSVLDEAQNLEFLFWNALARAKE